MEASSDMTPDRIMMKLADDMDQLNLKTHLSIIWKFCEDAPGGLTDIVYMKKAVREEVAKCMEILGEEVPDD